MIATRRISFNLYDKPRLYSYEWYPEKLGYCEVINPANTSVATRNPSFSRDHPSHPKLGELRLEIDARQNSDKGAPICHRIEIFGNQQCGRRHEKAIKCRSWRWDTMRMLRKEKSKKTWVALWHVYEMYLDLTSRLCRWQNAKLLPRSAVVSTKTRPLP